MLGWSDLWYANCVQEGWLQKYQANEEGGIVARKAEKEVGMGN